jgi:tripartite-type tricarboxylate transporter receptor subunit TctC
MTKLPMWLALAVLLPMGGAKAADAVTDFYKGKTVYMQIGAGAGSVYDVVGRTFARHMGKYIPGNPNIVVQIVPGGGSLALANQFGNTTPRDGTYFGVFNNGMPTTPLFDPKSARFDPRKFHYLGSPSREAHVLGVWHTSPVKSIDDVFGRGMIVGATSPGAAPYDFPRLTNALAGTKFKIITGYADVNDRKLAMQRGEIDGEAGAAWNSVKVTYMDLIQSKQILIIAAFGMKQNKELTNVPLFPTGKTEQDRQLFELMYGRQNYGRPFVTPPDVPAERVKALREAFESTLKDKDFLAEAARQNMELDPVSADELTELTKRLFETPQEVVQRMQATLASETK